MKILESLAVVRNYYGTLFDCIVRSEVWKPDENELQKFKDARFEIEKYAAAGAYLIFRKLRQKHCKRLWEAPYTNRVILNTNFMTTHMLKLGRL